MTKRKRKELSNPFVHNGYEGADYFCDRTEETENIISALQNGRNITLVSPRRMGKTGLIKHVFGQMMAADKDAICIYIDVFATQNLHDFVTVFSRALIEEAILREKSMITKVLDAFKTWRPVFSADPLTGAPTVSVSIEPAQAEYTLRSIFDHLGSIRKKVYVAIDEFQQVNAYPERGTEALLRSYIQFSHVGFIFSGSRQHLMSEMFLSPKRPFYQSTQFVALQPLHESIYYDFSRSFFEARKGSLAPEAFHALYHAFGGCTWYIQLILNRLFNEAKHIESKEQVNATIADVLDTMSLQYEGLVNFLTPNQFALLKAIAKSGLVEQPQGQEFLKKYNLPGASSVKSALDILTERELIYHQSDGYIVYDRFLGLWLQRYF